MHLFLLTRLSRGATSPFPKKRLELEISTHAPLARRDNSSACKGTFQFSISTHAPLARRDAVPFNGQLRQFFISTHAPLARRDTQFLIVSYTQSDFYSRASREARRFLFFRCYTDFEFLLTRLSRGATPDNYVFACCCPISTHAPLARRDYLSLRYF